MKSKRLTIANWGNYPKIKAEVESPSNQAEVSAAVSTHKQLIARGNGKCYGDAALSPQILSTLGLNQLIAFDAEEGTINCESGVLLADLLNVIVPAGWFFHVTPGIKNITVGGAIASDVHGKNHPEKGCFSNWLLSFELMLANGECVHCSREENTRLFWLTCGGMGWTGIILSAKFQLMPVSSMEMRQKVVRAENLEAIFEAFNRQSEWPYAAAWVDCLASGAKLGRGVVYFAEHVSSNSPASTLKYPHKATKNVPFYAPSWLLNSITIKAHNHMLFSKAQTSEQIVDVDRYFYPLDSIRNWNRLYGRRGFIQYQFCLPEANSQQGIQKVLELIGKSEDTPFLSVLKRYGERPKEAVNSFPIKGYSLALDFPRTRTILALIEQLDDLVWEDGGKIYLAKDACSNGRMGRVDSKVLEQPKFYSLLKGRLMEPR